MAEFVPAPEPDPINAVCPLSGKAVDAAIHSTVDGQRIAFCCPSCKLLFDVDPESHLPKIPEFVPAEKEGKKGRSGADPEK